jgi:hypothetical protein
MPKKRYNAEEIIHKLREADVLLSQGKTVSQACYTREPKPFDDEDLMGILVEHKSRGRNP